MVSSLLAMAVLAILGALVYRLTRTQIVESIYHMRLAQAHELAEAGVEDALRELTENPAWRTGFTNKPFAGGSYTVRLSTHFPPHITASGYSKVMLVFGRAVKNVEVRTSYIPVLGAAGSFCRAGSQFKVDGVTDAYDSLAGVDPASFFFGSHIWSNGSVVTKENVGVRIRGNVIYYSGAGPKADSVEGFIQKTTVTASLPFHDGTPYVDANDNLTGLTPQSVYAAATKKVKVPAGVTATLNPGRYYFNEVEVLGTLLVATDSGAVEIYLNGNWNAPSTPTSGRTMNTSRYPARFSIYGQGADKFYLQSTTPLHVNIEARQSQVDLFQELYGKVVGNMVTVSENGKLHFDVQMGGVGGIAVEPGSWSESYERL